MCSAIDSTTQGGGGTRALADADDLALFHASLAALCRGGMALGRALRLAGADVSRTPLGPVATALADAVDAGTPIERAYAEGSRGFPPLYRALVAAGVASGDLPTALDQIASHARTEGDATRRIRRALIHPVVTASCALVVGVAAVLFAAPAMGDLTEAATEVSSTPIALGALGVLAALLGTVLVLAWKRSPLRGVRGAALPGVGPLRTAAAQAAIVSTLALLLRRGMPLHDALALTATSCADADLRARVSTAARRVHEGEGLAAALSAEGACDPSVLWLVESADGSSGVVRALEDVGGLLHRRFERGLDRFTAWLRPIAELALGAVVLVFAYAYLIPLVRSANRVLQLWTS